ncbi:MAG: FAD-dependent oxidoreductase [Succinivibrio sp.]|nr:FAD-dependent oxidoreductase [Succinivibrio sp.]
MGHKELHCDTVVIGAGTAGVEAYRGACERSGRICILVDDGPLGTSAQRNGELPASFLMYAGLSMRALNELKRLGISSSATSFDTSGLLKAIRGERSRSTSEVLSFMYCIPEERRLHGRASFSDPHTLIVNGQTLVHFKSAVIATGSEPLVTYEQSRIPGILTTSELYEQNDLPASVAVFGSSSVGLQLGQSLSYLGVETMVFGQRRLWELTDDAVLSTALNMFSERFPLAVDSFITSIESQGGGYDIYYIDDGRYENYLHTAGVIAASSRVPNISRLNLSEIGVKVSRSGRIIVDRETMQTTVPHIFAAGGVCSEDQSTALTETEGHYAGINAASFPQLRPLPRRIKLRAVMTDPELAIAGLSLEEMKERALRTGRNFVIGQSRFERSFSGLGINSGGILRLYADEESGAVLGAEICSGQAHHIAQLLALAIAREVTVDELSDFSFLHLSDEEAIAQAARHACETMSRRRQALA